MQTFRILLSYIYYFQTHKPWTYIWLGFWWTEGRIKKARLGTRVEYVEGVPLSLEDKSEEVAIIRAQFTRVIRFSVIEQYFDFDFQLMFNVPFGTK